MRQDPGYSASKKEKIIMKEFDLIGFEASEELQEKSQARLKKLIGLVLGVVGYDAYIVKTREGFFEGAIKIHTIWHTFNASYSEESPEVVLDVLCDQIKKKIAERRRLRRPVLSVKNIGSDVLDWECAYLKDGSVRRSAS